MNSKQIIAKAKAYPFAISLVVVAVALAGWTYWRSSGAQVEAQEEFEKVTQQNELISKNSSSSELLGEQLAELNTDADKLGAGLINPVEDISNQQYFYDLEQAAGVEQISDPIHLDTSRTKEPANPSVATFTLSVSGHWDDLMNFLYSLQAGPHPLRVTIFHLTKSQQSHGVVTDSSLLSLTLTVELLGK
jgi:hypothetical protein